MVFVFDACTLIAYLNNEQGSDAINDLLKKAIDNDHEIYGDCIGLATAIELSGQFISSDHHELDAVAIKEPSLIFWFR